MNTKRVSLLLLLALLFAATTNHVAEAVFAAPQASPSRDEGEGWYFREFSIRVGSNPGPGMSEERYTLLPRLENRTHDASMTFLIRAKMPLQSRALGSLLSIS